LFAAAMRNKPSRTFGHEAQTVILERKVFKIGDALAR
jgi:hypothetical protein